MSKIKRAIALGFFDGVHIGHGALLNRTKERAAQIKGIPSVLSFDVHPDTLVFGKEVPLINSALSREEIIRRCYGIENVIFIHFNQHTMRMPWKEFADTIIEELNLGWIVVGHDFCFGYKGQGTAARLKEYCEERGIGCDIIPAVSLDESRSAPPISGRSWPMGTWSRRRAFSAIRTRCRTRSTPVTISARRWVRRRSTCIFPRV